MSVTDIVSDDEISASPSANMRVPTQVPPNPTTQLGLNKGNISDLVKNRKKDICGHCMTKCTRVGPDSLAFCCDMCDYWYHAACDMGVDAEKFVKFNEVEGNILNSVKIYCNFEKCHQTQDQIKKMTATTWKRINDHESRITVLETRVDEQDNKIETKISDEVKATTVGLIQDKIKEVWELEQDRAKRSRNLIFKNVPENTGANQIEIASKDVETITDIITDTLEIGDSLFKIHTAYRLGKERTNNTPRMVKVVFDREYMASEILKNKKKLQESSDRIISKMEVFKDRSPQDREKIKDAVIKMKEGNETLKTTIDPNTGLPTKNKYVIRGLEAVLVDENNRAVSI